jgi:hypothetical protein
LLSSASHASSDRLGVAVGPFAVLSADIRRHRFLPGREQGPRRRGQLRRRLDPSRPLRQLLLHREEPVREGTIAWDVEQSYRGGEVVKWTGPPGSDTPASRTEITESAVPVDTLDVVSGTTAAAPPLGSASAGTSEGHDKLALVLSLVAIGLALVAVLFSLLRGRPIV